MSITAANWAGVTVILKGGKRLGWKITRGCIPRMYAFSDRNFGGFLPQECSTESARLSRRSPLSRA